MSIVSGAEAAQRSVDARQRAALHRRAQVLVLHQRGMKAHRIAVRLGVTERTVWRDLADADADRVRVEEIIEDEFVNAEDLHSRLTAMFDADLADICDTDGTLKPIAKWPAVWRQGLLAGIEIEEQVERSHDGEQKGESKSWDKTGGRVLKVKMMDRSKIFEMLGRLKTVSAFEQQKQGDVHLHAHLHQEIGDRLAKGRARLAAPQDIEGSGSTSA